jgi:nucleotide-binding universal stress UspA family protein
MREPVGPVVVGVDGSLASLDAVDLAAEDAAARMRPLVVVHATADESDLDGPHSRSRRMLAVAIARVRAEHPGLSVEGAAAHGGVVDVLAEASAEACLLVVGHRRHAGPAGTVGATATRIVGRTAAPLLVHRVLDTPGIDPRVRPVLAGVSGTAGIDDVLAFAFEEASSRGAPVIALHVRSRNDGAARVTEAERVMRAAVAGWAEKHPEVHASAMVRYGMDVPLPLVAASRMAQLVVVGAPSRGRPANAGATSVSSLLIRRAHCPVAVVPRS